MALGALVAAQPDDSAAWLRAYLLLGGLGLAALALVAHAFRARGPVAQAGYTPGGTSIAGGAWRIESCRIVERVPGTSAPLWAQVTGSFDGVLRMSDPPSPDLHDASVRGSFSLLMTTVSLIASGSPIVDHLESRCEGGRSPR